MLTRFLALHRWFVRESRAYIGPYTWGDRLFWPRAWVHFMWLARRKVFHAE